MHSGIEEQVKQRILWRTNIEYNSKQRIRIIEKLKKTSNIESNLSEDHHHQTSLLCKSDMQEAQML